MARLILVDGSIINAHPENQVDFKIGELCRLIGCTKVERIVLNEDFEMWLDENSKIIGKPLNRNATQVFRYWHPDILDYITGTALVCRRGEVL